MKTYLTYLVILLHAYTALAQTITFADDSLKACVFKNYPTAFDENNNFIDSKAGAIRSLKCDSMGIKSITALNNFKNLKLLFFNFNDISSLAPISKHSQLSHIRFNENNIQQLPTDISSWSSLHILELENNGLMHMPALVGFDSLSWLYLDNNDLAALPLLNHLTSLELFFVANNKIKIIPPINKLTNLRRISFSNNQLETLPQLDSLKNLERLYISNNQLRQVGDLSMLHHLTLLTLDNNFLMNLPPLPSHAFDSVNLNYNYLLPDNISSITHYPNFPTTFFYKKQRQFPLSPNFYQANVGDYLNIPFIENTNDEVLDFQWFKNGIPYNNSRNLEINRLEENHTGTYQLAISSRVPALDSFTVYTETVTLKVISPHSPVLITPNNDGENDTYAINKTGKITIVDKRGDIINTLMGPIVWDCTDAGGNLLTTGVYFLIFETGETPVELSILR